MFSSPSGRGARTFSFPPPADLGVVAFLLVDSSVRRGGISKVMARVAKNHTVRFRVDFSPVCSLGPGKIELLESIGRTGSLSQAARALGLSYRRAWLLLNDLNHSFSEPAATARIGGNLRGGMTLTAVGKEIIRCYRSAAQAIESVARSKLQSIATKAVSHGRRNGGPPRKRLARQLHHAARS